MESKDIKNVKEMEDGDLLREYVEAVNEYDENPKNKENKFRMLDLNLEILKRMAR